MERFIGQRLGKPELTPCQQLEVHLEKLADRFDGFPETDRYFGHLAKKVVREIKKGQRDAWMGIIGEFESISQEEENELNRMIDACLESENPGYE